MNRHLCCCGVGPPAWAARIAQRQRELEQCRGTGGSMWGDDPEWCTTGGTMCEVTGRTLAREQIVAGPLRLGEPVTLAGAAPQREVTTDNAFIAPVERRAHRREAMLPPIR